MIQLYLDMDGVLADFDTGYHLQFGIRPNKKDDNVDWNIVRKKSGFYRNLPPMLDFDLLWKSTEWLNPIILTGVPKSVPEAAENKREWVDKNIGKHATMITCPSKDKCKYADFGDILIDDWEKYKHLWESVGGKWITHTSTGSSLRQLHEVLMKS